MGLMYGNQFGPIRKGCFNLYFIDHFRNAFHHIVT